MRGDFPVYFVGGTGRAGAGIVQKALALHPDVASLPFEPRFMIDPDGIVDVYSTLCKVRTPFESGIKIRRLESLLESLGKDSSFHSKIGKWLKGKMFLTSRKYSGYCLSKTFPNYDIQVKKLISDLSAAEFSGRWVGSPSYEFNPKMTFAKQLNKTELAKIMNAFLLGLVEPYARNLNKRIFIEDDSWNIFFGQELIEIVPNAKFLHVYRDPRDVVASFISKNWCPTNLKDAVTYYKQVIHKSREVARTLPKGRVLEINIEKVVESQKESLTRICDHFDLGFHENMINVGLVPDSFGRWMTDFNATDRKFVNSALANEIVDLGYQPS